MAWVSQTLEPRMTPIHRVGVGPGKLLPALTNTVVLGSKSHGIHVVHIACLPTKFVLALNIIVILGFESHRSYDHILMSDGSGS
jgi:hypothetical protein